MGKEMNEFRKFLVLGTTEYISISQLKPGDKFKSFEQDGKEIPSPDGSEWMTAVSKPQMVDGVWGIEVEGHK